MPSCEHEIAVYLQGYRTSRQKAFQEGEGYHFSDPRPSAWARRTGEPRLILFPRPDPYRIPATLHQPRVPAIRAIRATYERRRDRPDAPPSDRRANAATIAHPTAAPSARSLRFQPATRVIIDGERWDSPRLHRLWCNSPWIDRVEVRKDGFKPYTTRSILPVDTSRGTSPAPRGNSHRPKKQPREHGLTR